MSLEFLLDTNILSEPQRPWPRPAVLEKLTANRDVIATAAPVWHELVHGAQRLPASRRRTALEAYLDEVVRLTIPILPYDEAAAERHASERARLSRLSITVSFVDGQIAAVAAANNLVLITGNVRHFTPFKGLKVADWSRD